MAVLRLAKQDSSTEGVTITRVDPLRQRSSVWAINLGRGSIPWPAMDRASITRESWVAPFPGGTTWRWRHQAARATERLASTRDLARQAARVTPYSAVLSSPSPAWTP